MQAWCDWCLLYVQDGNVEAPVPAVSAELLQFTDKYLDADDGPKHVDDQRKQSAVLRLHSVLH